MTFKRFFACFWVILLSFGMTNTSFAKGSKQSICHFDNDAGLFSVINISSNAIEKHKAKHGDVDPDTFYADTDGDGFGDANGTTNACPNPGFVANADDAFPDDPGENADSDGDGFGDNNDACPDEFGVAPDGCPLVVADGVDLLVVNRILHSHSNGITALLNDGVGNFPSGNNFSLRLGVSAVEVADFNNDDQDDFIAAHNGGHPDVYVGIGNGTGGFAVSSVSRLFIGGVQKIAVGDFNNDTKVDVAFAGVGVQIALDVNGVLTKTSDVPGDARSIAVGDIDDDGNLDFAIINHGASHFLTLFYGDGTGENWVTTNVESGGVYLGVVMGDVNNDGLLDLVTGAQPEKLTNPRGIGVFLNDGNILRTFTKTLFPLDEVQVYARVLEDFNCDGYLDLVTTGLILQSPGVSKWTVQVYYNDGAGNFGGTPDNFVMEGGEINDAAVGDVTGDGFMDIIVTNLQNSLDIIPSTGVCNSPFGISYRVTSTLMNTTVGVAVGNFD